MNSFRGTGCRQQRRMSVRAGVRLAAEAVAYRAPDKDVATQYPSSDSSDVRRRTETGDAHRVDESPVDDSYVNDFQSMWAAATERKRIDRRPRAGSTGSAIL